MKILVALTALLSCLCVDLSAQNTPPVSGGLYGGLNLNFHNPSFPTPNPVFTNSSTGTGAAIGLALDYPTSSSLSFGLRLGYTNLSGKLESIIGGSLTDSTITDTRTASLPQIEFMPNIRLNNFLTSKMYGLFGLELGVPINQSYTQSIHKTYRIGPPKDTSISGGIPDDNIRFGITAGLGYDFAIAEATHLQPEISIHFPFTKVSSAASFDSWTVPQLRVGINLMFDLSKPEKQPDIEREPFVEPSIKRVVSYSDKGDTVDVSKVRVEDIQYSELYPLVPYIFFNQNGLKTDTALVVPTKRETGDVTDITTLNDAVKVNLSILDLVCMRMKKYESARLSITGTNDGKAELKSKDLARQRAEQVKKYLVDCGIAPERLDVNARDLPEKASSSTIPDGQAENRRVELHSDMPDLLSPVVSK